MNPIALAALLAPAILGAPARGTLDLADRTEARGGYLGTPQDPVLNLETLPSATLKADTHRTNFMLQYAPHLGLSDVQLGLRPYLLNAGAAELGWHSRAFRLTLDEVASYGQLNTTSALPTSSVAATTGAGPTVTPGTSTAPGSTSAATTPAAANNARLYDQLTYQASTTTLTALFTPERPWSLRLAGSYALSGGANGAAREFLTYQYGPRFEATLDIALTRRDRLVTQASVERSTVLSTITRSLNGVPVASLDATYDYVFLRATEGYTHNFSRFTEGSLSGGITEVHSDLRFTDRVFPPTAPSRFWDTYPTAELSVIQHLPVRDKFDLQIRALLAPSANRLTGLLSQQVQGVLNANWQRSAWTYLAEGAWAQSLKNDDVVIPGSDQILSNKVTYASLRAGAAYAFTRYCSLEGGVILAYQQAGNFGALWQRMGYLAFSVHHPTLEF